MKINSISRTADHRVNEDSLYCKELSHDCVLTVLADGMGGLSHGDIASQLVCAKVSEVIEQGLNCMKPEDAILRSLKEADLCIGKESVSRKCKMGAAVLVALFVKGRVYFAWQGNVRLYRCSQGQLTQLTTDHVLSSEADHLLTRCINGRGFRTEPEVLSDEISPNTTYYLCTDGFYKRVSEEDIVAKGVRALEEGMTLNDDSTCIEIICCDEEDSII
jgi:serine/threonine protein phosphatase PrpC